MAKKNNKGIFLKVAIVAAVVVAGFGIYTVANKSNTDSGELEKTSLRLKWIHQAQFSGYYMAKKEGFYSKAGLDVTIDPAGPNISPIQMVTSGINDFGILGGSEIIKARSQGIPVVAIATILQNNPISLVSLKKDNITKPQDLIGKRVGVVYGNDEELYREYLRINNIDKSQVKEVAALPGGSQLLSGQVEVLMAYSTSVPVQLALKDVETNVTNLAKETNDMYGDTLFTTEAMIKNNPDKVRQFVQASLQGWKFAIANQDVTIDEVMKANPSLERAAQVGYLENMIPYMGDQSKLGQSKKETWERMQDILIQSKSIHKKIDVTQAFTNRFVE